ncbi:MAG TPA: hypothetical protein VET48_04800 [Steroidobacteraceae bacterium]|nr:hypothetical protein [Steroidobacteraceae bacterium]
MILYEMPDDSQSVEQPPVDSSGMTVVTVTASKPWYLNTWVQLAAVLGFVYWLNRKAPSRSR